MSHFGRIQAKIELINSFNLWHAQNLSHQAYVENLDRNLTHKIINSGNRNLYKDL